MNAPLKVALLWHGDREARNAATLAEGRFHGLAETLRRVGIASERGVEGRKASQGARAEGATD